MADEVDNLVLDQLRAIRADLTDLKAASTNNNQRIDELQTMINGLTYIMTSAMGTFMADMKDMKERVRTLEKA